MPASLLSKSTATTTTTTTTAATITITASSSSLSAAAAAEATGRITANKQQQQHKQQQGFLYQKSVHPLNGFPSLALGIILIALSIFNCFATLQANALNISIATAADNHTEAQYHQQQQQNLQQPQQLHLQQQQQQQQQHELQLKHQEQHQQQQQQDQLLAVIEKTLTVNHTLKSFSIIDMARSATAVIATETEVDKQPPVFDFGMPRNLTARTGQTEATIKCRVDQLNDKSVSWIRKRDLHILTVATSSYTSDKRFEATHSKDFREWTLHVKAPQQRDSGIYECQVNTEPKMSMAFQLNILVTSPDAKAIISGPPDLHFKAGSAIILNCIVQQPSFKDIGPIYWYRGEQMLTPLHKQSEEDDENSVNDDDDGDDDEVATAAAAAAAATAVSVAVADAGPNNSPSVDDVERDITRDFMARIAMESQLGDTLKSRLRISNAQTTDTGNYTCQPTTASSASVMVHVINDENPAAMQKSHATSLYAPINVIAAITIINIATKVLPLLSWLGIPAAVVAFVVGVVMTITAIIIVFLLAVNSDIDLMAGNGIRIGHMRNFRLAAAAGITISMRKWAICFLRSAIAQSIKIPIRFMRNFNKKNSP